MQTYGFIPNHWDLAAKNDGNRVDFMRFFMGEPPFFMGKPWKDPSFFMGKSSISMVISYGM